MNDMDPSDEGQERSLEIDRAVEELRRRAEKIGLYMQDAAIATTSEEMAAHAAANSSSIRDAIEAGAEFLIMGVFLVGDQAFSKRVIDPEQHEFDKEAQVLLPDPAEELRKRLEEGKPLFDDED